MKATGILDLPTVTGAKPNRINEFGENLTYCVQALQTLGKLEQVNGAISMTLDKLPGIRGDPVRTDPEWEKWDFSKLPEEIRLWLRRNSSDSKTTEREFNEQRDRKREHPSKIYRARGQEFNLKQCVYCEDISHTSIECQKINNIDERKKILARNVVFFVQHLIIALRNVPATLLQQHCKK